MKIKKSPIIYLFPLDTLACHVVQHFKLLFSWVYSTVLERTFNNTWERDKKNMWTSKLCCWKLGEDSHKTDLTHPNNWPWYASTLASSHLQTNIDMHPSVNNSLISFLVDWSHTPHTSHSGLSMALVLIFSSILIIIMVMAALVVVQSCEQIILRHSCATSSCRMRMKLIRHCAEQIACPTVTAVCALFLEDRPNYFFLVMNQLCSYFY